MPFHMLQLVRSIPIHILRLENGTPLCGASPHRPLWGVPLLPTPGVDNARKKLHFIYHMRQLIKSP